MQSTTHSQRAKVRYRRRKKRVVSLSEKASILQLYAPEKEIKKEGKKKNEKRRKENIRFLSREWQYKHNIS